MKFRYEVPMDDILNSNSKNPVQNKVIKEYVDNSVKNISASNITSGKLSTDRLPIIPMNKGGTGTGFSWLESADLQEKPRVILIKEDADGSRYLDAYSTLPVLNGGLGSGNIVNAPDNTLLVKQTDDEGRHFIDYTRYPVVESILGYVANESYYNIIGYIGDSNRVILGAANNSNRTEVRSPSAVGLLCQGGTDYEGTYALRWYYYPYGSCCILNPSTNGIARLGSASFRWSQLYAATTTISTSDRNMKKNIQNLDDRYMELFDLIEPISFQFTDGVRTHTGFIAQDVEDAMEKVGLTAEELAFFCKDIKTVMEDEKEVPVLDDEGNPVYIYALRYEEYIAIMAEKVKRMEKKYNTEIDSLKDEIALLKEQVNELKELILA